MFDQRRAVDLRALLRRIATRLNEGNALNWTVWSDVYVVPALGEESTQRIVSAGVGPNAIIGEAHPCAPDDLVREVIDCFSHRGDHGAHPNLAYLDSSKFAESLLELKAAVSAFATDADMLQSFFLKDGHPAYPVFWDFAFVRTKRDMAFILMGASSD